MTACPTLLQVLLFAENKDYENIKSLYLEAAKDIKGKVCNHALISPFSICYIVLKLHT